MAVYTPNIDAQSTEAGRQNDVTVGNAILNRNTDLATLLTQYGSLNGLYSALEGTQGAADATAIGGETTAAGADQTQRYNAQHNTQIDQALSQILADRQAAQSRKDATDYQGRLDTATGGVNNAYSGYDDQFYKDYAQKIIDASLPGIQQKYADIQRTTKGQLADAGNLRGSAAARVIAKILAQQTSETGQLSNSASNSAQSLRSQIESQRQNALTAALAAAGTQQNTPVGGATLSDILDAVAKAGPYAPPALPAAPSTAITNTPTPAPTNVAPAQAPPGNVAPPTVTDQNDPNYQKWLYSQFASGFGGIGIPGVGGGFSIPDVSLDAYNKSLAGGPTDTSHLTNPTLVAPKASTAIAPLNTPASPAQQGLAPVDPVAAPAATGTTQQSYIGTAGGGSTMPNYLGNINFPGGSIDLSNLGIPQANVAPTVEKKQTSAIDTPVLPLNGTNTIEKKSSPYALVF